MTEKVVGLRGQPVLEAMAEPSPRVVAAVEDLLEKAKTGEVQGIVGSYVYRDGSTGSIVVGIMSYSMAGRAHILATRALNDLEDLP